MPFYPWGSRLAVANKVLRHARERVLISGSGFYEYTSSADPKHTLRGPTTVHARRRRKPSLCWDTPMFPKCSVCLQTKMTRK